jgi:hypothetical protein
VGPLAFEETKNGSQCAFYESSLVEGHKVFRISPFYPLLEAGKWVLLSIPIPKSSK